MQGLWCGGSLFSFFIEGGLKTHFGEIAEGLWAVGILQFWDVLVFIWWIGAVSTCSNILERRGIFG